MNKPTNPAKITPHNVMRFIKGWVRWIVFTLSSRSKAFEKVADSLELLSSHKEEQFRYRLQVMRPSCLKNGQCDVCGCQTPQLQMIDEACDGGCYPAMMEKEEWEKYKQDHGIVV